MAKKSQASLVSVVEEINPQLAARYLACNTNNRKIRRGWVVQLTKMMKSGDWKLTHQGIAFNCDGSLRDGQHRLTAIVEAGVTVPMVVTRGLPNDAVEVIDTHQRRSEADAMTLHGFEVNHHDIAVAKRMKDSITSGPESRMTRPEVIRFVIKHQEAIRFSNSGGYKAGLSQASLRAPVARAWYTADRSRLTDFLECLRTGIMQSQADQAAIALRNIVLNNPILMQGGSQSRAIAYRRTESALVAFLERRKLQSVREVSEEKFPLPEETLL